ncbi:MAG: type toxin-antitoxin system HipA family toxin [Ferruginibacter sp.]|nr:type toxin-antitoxin system HipA family toxin [Ferruginibacter sp.]
MNNCWFCYKDAGDTHYHQACAKKFFGTAEVPKLALDDALIESLAKQTVNQRIAVTGVQPKLSLTLQKEKGQSRLTIVGLWGEFILKPQHHGYPMMPETEDLTMHLARLFKIPVCDHTLLQASDGSMVYVARRFDRVEGKKIHMEDLCQLSEFLTEYKYKSSYEKAGKLVAHYCHKGLDLLNYFELVLFSYLCGNNDMHLKNFSLMHQPEGVVLGPAYDLLNVNLLNPKDEEELALTLNGKKHRIKLTDFKALAENLGINEKVYYNSFKLFSSKNEEVMDLIDRSFLDKKMKKSYKDIWMKKQDMFG